MKHCVETCRFKDWCYKWGLKVPCTPWLSQRNVLDNRLRIKFFEIYTHLYISSFRWYHKVLLCVESSLVRTIINSSRTKLFPRDDLMWYQVSIRLCEGYNIFIFRPNKMLDWVESNAWYLLEIIWDWEYLILFVNSNLSFLNCWYKTKNRHLEY